MTRFVDATDFSCRTPISGNPGPDMLICGNATLPGRTFCPECKPRLYYRPTARELRGLDFKAGRPIQPVRTAR